MSQIGLDSVKNTLKCRFIANILVILSQISYLSDSQSNAGSLIYVTGWFLQICIPLPTLSTICIEWKTSWCASLTAWFTWPWSWWWQRTYDHGWLSWMRIRKPSSHLIWAWVWRGKEMRTLSFGNKNRFSSLLTKFFIHR